MTTCRQNLYPYRIDDLADGTQRFDILIENPKVVPASERTRKAAATRRKKKAAKSSPAGAPKEARASKAEYMPNLLTWMLGLE